jgi:guanidinoacetate N-methyltransferase
MRRRFPEFDLSVDVRRPDFIATPRPEQRNWLMERLVDEFTDELLHLDEVARRLVGGGERPAMRGDWMASPATFTGDELVIDGQQVMQSWQEPLMAALARQVAGPGRDVLEIGFGMGLAATHIQRIGVRSHTIVEANAGVADVFTAWRAGFPDRDIRLVDARWEDVLDGLGTFDGVLFDTYPASEEEYLEHVVDDVTFAAHFFASAAAHLRPGGAFTYYSNEIDSVGRAHQRSLLEHFDTFAVEVVRGLRPPPDAHNWWADSMVVVRAGRHDTTPAGRAGPIQ